jgi:hypothetical protein
VSDDERYHIRNEAVTRQHFGRVGDEKDLPIQLCITYCHNDISNSMTFFYLGADHAVQSVKYGNGQVCPHCAVAVVDVLGPYETV